MIYRRMMIYSFHNYHLPSPFLCIKQFESLLIKKFLLILVGINYIKKNDKIFYY